MSEPSSDSPPSYEEATRAETSFPAPPPLPPHFRTIDEFPPPPPFDPQQTIERPINVHTTPQSRVFSVVQPNPVVTSHPIKYAPSFESYKERCPYCRVDVVTQVKRVAGGCSCLILIFGLIFLPLLLCLFFDGIKDAHHLCPRCHRVISVRINSTKPRWVS